MIGLAAWCQRTVPARLWLWLLQQRNRALSHWAPEPYRSVLPFTMIGIKRLRNLHALAQRIDRLGVGGDVVECGTCNGGSGALLAGVASRSPYRRHTWLLDSFAGLPASGPCDSLSDARYSGLCRGSPHTVRQVLRRSHVPADAVTVVSGWFQQTAASLPVERIALLHVDADLYESVRAVLDGLFGRVAEGGFVILDDYGTWEGCRRACSDFMTARRLPITLMPVDGHAVYFQKPARSEESPREFQPPAAGLRRDGGPGPPSELLPPGRPQHPATDADGL